MSDEVVIVTGGAQGIGREFVRALVAQGAKVAIADLKPSDELVDELGEAHVLGQVTDITDDKMIGQFVEATAEQFGKPSVLINNAALFAGEASKMLEEHVNEDWDRMFKVNVRSVWQMSRAVLPAMRSIGRGRILNVGSGIVFKAPPGQMAYIASKGAVHALTRALARELGPDNIQVNCLAPSFTLSENVLKNDDLARYFESAKQARVLQRDMVPQDLIGAMLFLASSANSFMTGQVVNVDGGAYFN